MSSSSTNLSDDGVHQHCLNLIDNMSDDGVHQHCLNLIDSANEVYVRAVAGDLDLQRAISERVIDPALKMALMDGMKGCSPPTDAPALCRMLMNVKSLAGVLLARVKAQDTTTNVHQRVICDLKSRVKGQKKDLAKAKKELEKAKRAAGSDDPLQCPICYDAPRDSVMVPCGHTACSGCITASSKCPFCRRCVGQVVKIYLS